MRRVYFLSVALLTLVLAAVVLAEAPDATRLSMEELYQVKPFQGKAARRIQFSEKDGYVAFLWNPYDEPGYDLYVFNTATGKLTRVTSLEVMKAYDPPEDHDRFLLKWKQKETEDQRLQEMFYAQRDYLMGKDVDLERFEREDLESLKKELEQEKLKKEAEKKKDAEKAESDTDKTDKKTDAIDKKNDKSKDDKELELWELRDKLKEKKKKEAVTRRDLYPGVSQFRWSRQAPELIFNYRGDLYRYSAVTGKIDRLTMTDDAERLVDWTPNGDGYYFTRGNEVYRVLFGSSYVQQINHRLFDDPEFKNKDAKDKFKIADTSISPNGEWMLQVAEHRKGKPATRTINIMDYDHRFAQPKPIKRDVADDKRNEPAYRFYLRPIASMNYGPEPQPVFEIPGGDVWYEFSNIEWSKDGSHYAFITWQREKGQLKIWLGKAAAGQKPEMLYEMPETIGYKSFYQRNLKFSPDNKHLAAIIDTEDGFRQPVLFDIQTKEMTHLLTGKFESYPILSFSRDGRDMFVLSDKLDQAHHSVYRLSVASGEMTRIGRTDGMHRETAVAHDGSRLATMFGNWDIAPELHYMTVATGGDEVLTHSHSKKLEEYNFIKPEFFTYKNRHGDVIHGIVFKPKGWKATDKRPGIVYMYGGPLNTAHTIEADNYSRLAYIFQMIMAAKHGYVTVNIDPRGQSGYGRHFNEANWENPGNSQVEDLEDLVKFMSAGFGVDTSRLGLHGWSFGGYQTIKTMLSSPDTFACAIAVASVTEWENYNAWYAGSTIGKSVRGKPTLREYSLIPLAYRLKHPLLLIHGMVDPNVLFQDTLHMYKALMEAGKETLVDLFLDPEGEHGLGVVLKNKAIFKKFESWFMDKLGPVRPADVAQP